MQIRRSMILVWGWSPKPTPFSGMRALNFVLENERVDRTLLFNVSPSHHSFPLITGEGVDTHILHYYAAQHSSHLDLGCHHPLPSMIWLPSHLNLRYHCCQHYSSSCCHSNSFWHSYCYHPQSFHMMLLVSTTTTLVLVVVVYLHNHVTHILSTSAAAAAAAPLALISILHHPSIVTITINFDFRLCITITHTCSLSTSISYYSNS